MIISYHGLSCFKISTKSNDGHEHILVTDPFDAKKAGINAPKLKANVAISSSATELHNNIDSIKSAGDNELFTVSSPGEYEVYDIFIQGNNSGSEGVVYYLEIERVKIAFVGSLKSTKLSQSQLELIENSDILIVPIGGGPVLNAKQASELVNQLEPRIVIPCFYKAPGIKIKELTDTTDSFFKELGVSPDEKEDKLKITYKDLPQEELQVVELTF